MKVHGYVLQAVGDTEGTAAAPLCLRPVRYEGMIPGPITHSMDGIMRFLAGIVSLLAVPALVLAARGPTTARSHVTTEGAAATEPAPDTVRVAVPSGEPDVDRPMVQAAFDRVRPGGTVLFAPGTYVLGEGARLTVPDVTVVGHPDGTVIRGCAPERFEVLPTEADDDFLLPLVLGCTGLWVHAHRQTIRGLTFEHTWHGIFIGPPIDISGPPADGPPPPSFGGHTIEGNLFRNVPNGMRVVGPADAPTTIRGNRVENAYHAFQSNGATVHVMANRVSVPSPDAVPTSRYPESGVILSAGPASSCEGHRVVGNVVEGTVHGIQVLADPRAPCRNVEIRENVIRLRPVPLPPAYPRPLMDYFFGAGATGSVVSGVPIRLDGAADGSDDTAGATITDVLIQDNRILGGDGLGIQLVGVSGTRILDNEISGIRTRSPFPGLTWGEDSERWRRANGAGVWVSPGSAGNEIAGNTFGDIPGPAVVLQGDGNRVELKSARDRAEDLGEGNRVTAGGAG